MNLKNKFYINFFAIGIVIFSILYIIFIRESIEKYLGFILSFFITFGVINFIFFSSIIKRIENITKYIKDLGNENAKKILKNDSKILDEIGEISKNLNIFIDDVESIVVESNFVSEEIANRSMDLTGIINCIISGKNEGNRNNISSLKNQTEDILKGVENQTASTQEISANISEISYNLNNLSKNTEETMKFSNETLNYAKIGRESLEESLTSILSVEDTVKKIEKKSLELINSSEKIGNIVSMISQISERTNLLSLNAAIEAARAGEAGKGFAVVAEEVRTLADNSNSASREIEDLIRVIQNEIREVTSSIRETYTKVENSRDNFGNTREKFLNIVSKVDSTNEQIENISNSIIEQAKSIDEIDIVTRSIAENSEEIGQLSTEQNISFDNIAKELNNVLNYSKKVSEISLGLKNIASFFTVNLNKSVNERTDLVKWSEKFSVNVEQFDNEHKNLLNIINKLNKATLEGEGINSVNEILDELIDYTAFHFKNEEELFQKYKYPYYKEHKKTHDSIIEKVLEMKDKFNENPDDENVIYEIMELLKKWIINHILGTDKKYSDFFKNKKIK